MWVTMRENGINVPREIVSIRAGAASYKQLVEVSLIFSVFSVAFLEPS